MTGQEVRELLRQKRIYQWEVAAAMNMSEYALCRWLRGALDDEKEQAIFRSHRSVRTPWRALRGAGMMCCGENEKSPVRPLGKSESDRNRKAIHSVGKHSTLFRSHEVFKPFCVYGLHIYEDGSRRGKTI